jgi:murein DD-endopeptidase MepM/ murein hydrolase activator NlpD
MTESSTSNDPFRADLNSNEQNDPLSSKSNPRSLGELWQTLVEMGLGEASIRVGSGLASLALVLMVVWVMSNFYLKGQVAAPQSAAVAASLPTPTPTIEPPRFELQANNGVQGIFRLALLHTSLPNRPRFEFVEYEIQAGDTLFTIADRFGLKPQSLMWTNPKELGDPHWITPGQVIKIPPTDGAVYEWHAGDGLNAVARFFKVTPEDIINWPGNNLTLESVGDFAAPNITPGTLLFVPGGQGQFITWNMPRITRDNPAVAKTVGPGYCGTVYDGAVGTSTFVWPAATRYISGYRYQPEINHFGIDIGGSTGVGIYASDNGVIVYAGWNDFGYGNLIVIDHGNGWQTYYAHLSQINVICGQSVYQGDLIGLMGSTGRSTGPHLHFEMRSDVYGKVDPLNFVQ